MNSDLTFNMGSYFQGLTMLFMHEEMHIKSILVERVRLNLQARDEEGYANASKEKLLPLFH